MMLKTNRRLILLAISVFLLAAAAFALFFVRQWQKDRMTDAFFHSGQEAFKAHDYYRALTDTGQYLNRVKDKPARRAEPAYADALLAYAESRRQIEENNGDHLKQAISWYQQYCDLRPADTRARFTLLQAHNQVGHFAEARDLADKMLPKDLTQATAQDAPTLRELAIALRRLGKNDASDPRLAQAVDRLLALDPLDVQGNLLRLEIDANTGHKPDARARADKLLEAHPNDPAALLVGAYARDIDPKGSDAADRHGLLCRAAGLDPRTAARVSPATYTDELFVLQLTAAFDDRHAFEYALAVLQDAADRTKSPLIERLLIRRLWQEGENDKVLARTASLPEDSVESQTEVLGFRALCLQRVGKADEAVKLAKSIAARQGDFRAAGWGAAIPLADPASKVPPAEAVAAWKSIVSLKSNPNEPVFQFYYGLALSAAGREDDARQAWNDARGLAIGASWCLPALRLAESYLVEGRAEDASRAANEAIDIAPGRAVVVVTWFEAQAARIQRGSIEPPTAAACLSRLDEAIPKLKEASTGASGDTARALLDRLIAPRVILLAHCNRTEDAKKAGLEAVRRDPPLAAELLQRLASVSAAERLGFEDECMSRVEATSGQTASVVLVKATALANAGRTDEGLALIREAAQKAPTDASLQLALARYLERTGNPEAAAAWARIGDQNAGDLSLQKACLQSAAAAADGAFIERTIRRYATLLGAEPASGDALCDTARARVAMHGTPSKADRDKAIGLLGAVVQAQPRLAEPKVLLASVLSYADAARDIRPDLPRAVKQLTEAAAMEPRNAGIALDLARLYQLQSQFDRSREVATRLASDTTYDDAVRRSAAEVLIAQGEPGPFASGILADIASKLGDQAPVSLLMTLAEAYVAQRQDQSAAAIYDRLAAGLANEPESMYMTARFYVLRTDPAKAQAVLARLDSLKTDPGVVDYVRARLAADTGDVPGAVARYEVAVAAAPGRADIWRQYVQMLLRAGKHADATAVAERAVKAAPGDTGLPTLVEQAKMFASPGGNVDLKAMIRALAMDPSQAEAVEALRAFDAATGRGTTPTVDALISIADRYPACIPVQLLVARRVAPAAPDRAINLARRAMGVSPNDPAPARSAAELCLGLSRWQEMLAAALEWQRRDPSRPVDSDIAVAQAYLGLHQYDKGLQALADRVRPAAAAPDGPASPGVVNIYARLLVGAGKDADARALLAPLLSNSATMRVAVWLAIASEETPTPAAAQSWIDQVLPAIPPDSVEERLGVAAAYSFLAGRFRDQAAGLLGKSAAMLEQMTQNPAMATAATWETLGVVRHTMHDLDGAETAYRKAIELDSKRAVALNNLAGILTETRNKPEEGLAMAQRAVDVAPTPDNLDTLASIQAALARRAQDAGDAHAGASFKTAADLYRRISQLDARNVVPLKRAAECYEKAGDPADAAQCYETILGYQGLSPQDAANTKNNWAMCLLRLNQSRTDLEHAVALAFDASKLSDQPAFLDTLGWCQLAAGHPLEAGVTFRSAIDRATARKIPMPSSSIGLAMVLAPGTAEQKAQAKELLDSVEAAQRDPAIPKLEPEDAEHLRKARALLDAPR